MSSGSDGAAGDVAVETYYHGRRSVHVAVDGRVKRTV